MIAPKLRFSEFKDEWFEKKLEEIATVERGKFSPRPRNDPKFYNGEMPFIQTGDVANCGIYLEKYTQTLNEEGIKVSKVFPKNSILITIAANIGDTAITRFPVACPDSLVAIQPLENIANTHFLNNLLELKKEYLDSQATQNAQKNINLQVLKPLELVIPNYQEQTKIAEFLSAVDDKISQLSRELELLNQYKKGVMQKIFSQEIRFKNENGEDFGEWEEVPLNFVCDVRDGTHDSPKYVKKGYPLVTSKNLKDGKLDLTDISLISQTDFDNINKRSKVHTGDIIFGMIGTIGNPVLLKESNFAIKNVALIKEKDELLNKFLIHFLNSSLFDRQVKVLNVGNTQKFLSLNQIRNLSVPKPTIQEQEKIAEFLTAIDGRIDHTTTQLNHTKQWKKGLLQQMFV